MEMTAAIAISVAPTGPMKRCATSVSGSFEAAVSGSTPKQASIRRRYSTQEIASPPRMLTGRSRRGLRISPATTAATSKPTQAKSARFIAFIRPSGCRGSAAGMSFQPANQSPAIAMRPSGTILAMVSRLPAQAPRVTPRTLITVRTSVNTVIAAARGHGARERGPELGRVVEHDLRDQRVGGEARDREQPADGEAGRPGRTCARA